MIITFQIININGCSKIDKYLENGKIVLGTIRNYTKSAEEIFINFDLKEDYYAPLREFIYLVIKYNEMQIKDS